MNRKLIAVWTVLCFTLTSIPGFANVRENLNLLRDPQSMNSASEYVFRNDQDETLMPVYLIGAVAKPGLYHIPARTDLVTLLALSGGTTEKADINKVTIKRQQGKEVTEVDVEKVMSMKDLKSPALGGNDVILVATKEPTVNTNWVTIVGILSGVMGIVVSGILINNQLKNK